MAIAFIILSMLAACDLRVSVDASIRCGSIYATFVRYEVYSPPKYVQRLMKPYDIQYMFFILYIYRNKKCICTKTFITTYIHPLIVSLIWTHYIFRNPHTTIIITPYQYASKHPHQKNYITTPFHKHTCPTHIYRHSLACPLKYLMHTKNVTHSHIHKELYLTSTTFLIWTIIIPIIYTLHQCTITAPKHSMHRQSIGYLKWFVYVICYVFLYSYNKSLHICFGYHT